MSGRGFAPRPGPLSRERDTRRRDAAVTVLTPHLEVLGPDLPQDQEWGARTRAWWDAWRRSPQAVLFTDVDWESLLCAAVMHERMCDGHKAAAVEVRLWSAKFGATAEDRARLRWTVAIR